MFQIIKKHQFLFEELVKRDFKQKYKRTVLGMMWSLLSPLLQLLVMSLVFKQIFGRNMAHYTIYLFAGNLVFGYFKDATVGGMYSLTANAGVISKINVPKYFFLLSKNVSSLINFGLTLTVFFLFVAFDGISFHIRFFMLLYPCVCLLLFNVGIGAVLSALYVFFKDIQYLYDVFTLLLMYVSAIFYSVDSYPANIQMLFYLNPVYAFIRYFRIIVLEGRTPSLMLHAVCAFYAGAALLIGALIYHKYNYKFIFNL